MASATKQALLAALSAAQGECISGQQLAQQLAARQAELAAANAARTKKHHERHAAAPER